MSTGARLRTGMASSGRRWAVAVIVTAGALVLSGMACGDDDSAPVTASVAALATRTAPEALPIDVESGPPISPDQAAHFLPLLYDGRQVQPVAAFGERFLLSESDAKRDASGVQTFSLWDPVSGLRTPVWTSEPGRQDIVTGIDGDIAIAVRTGLALPFADWRMEAHNLVTGESRTIAAAQSGVAGTPGVAPGPPFGFAPYPSVHNGRLAWVEFRNGANGVERQVRLHDLASGETQTLAVAGAASGEDLASASLGGDNLAWVRWSSDGSASVEVRNIPANVTATLLLEAKPYAIALDGAGTTLAWDDARGGKYTVSLDGGVVRRFAGDEGWGITVSGERFAWAPAAAYGGTGGYFDLGTNQLRLVARRPGVVVNQATVFGNWFAWQEVRPGASGAPDPALSGFHFMKLDPA